jgi:hypothetical protein
MVFGLELIACARNLAEYAMFLLFLLEEAAKTHAEEV